MDLMIALNLRSPVTTHNSFHNISRFRSSKACGPALSTTQPEIGIARKTLLPSISKLI